MKYQFSVDHIDTTTSHGKIINMIKDGASVLECGCATGYITKYLSETKHCNMSIVEYEQEAFDLAKQYAQDGVCADLNQPSWAEHFAGTQFDYILFMDVLEHLYNPRLALQSAEKLLKEDGKILISLPNIAHNDILINLNNNAFNYMNLGLLDDTHIRFFGKSNIPALFETTGLQLTEYDCTYMKTGASEQFWHEPCLVSDTLMELLSQREDGEIYQFILTAQKQSYCQAHHLSLVIDRSRNATTPFNDYVSKANRYPGLISELDACHNDLQSMTNAQRKMLDDLNDLIQRHWPYAPTMNNFDEALRLLEQDINLNSEAARTTANALTKARRQIDELNIRCKAVDGLEERCKFAEANYSMIANSRGHKMLNRYYGLRNKIIPYGTVRYNIVHGIIHPILQFFRNIKHKSQVQDHPIFSAKEITKDEGYLIVSSSRRMNILCGPHTMFIAKNIQSILNIAGIQCDILTEEPVEYENIPYIIICPQNYKHFPEVYIAYQLEQTISDRWLTDDYLEILRHAYIVFDYSLKNIEYFSDDRSIFSKLYYLPLDICQKTAEESRKDWDSEQTYDVLFYGADMAEHRQAFLKPISERFKIKVISEMFGEELYAEMRKAKLIVNIHYYENALLETTRLSEIMSVCNALIISEHSNDPTEEQRYEDLVDFVDIGDVDGMIERISYWLSHEDERLAKVRANRKLLDERANAMEFYFDRFLLANDCISFDFFYDHVNDFVQFDTDRICLSLPEETIRRASFDEDNQYGFQVFGGLKHYQGWIGCGLSYKFIFRKAMDLGFERVLICEDDTYFPDNFEERFAKIRTYADAHDDWNIFSGLMSDLGDVSILDCEQVNNETFVYLDHMISTVFNMYDKSIFQVIADWDNTNLDIQHNTIDRYLENIPLRILTTNPFLVGHKEDLFSTLWGAQNTTYTDLIANSSIKLNALVEEYLSKNS